MDNSRIQACLNGDPKAQRALYEQYKVPMYILCQRYASTLEDAKDTLQDGFIKVFRDLKQYDSEKGKLEYWIKKVFINTCLEAIRRKKMEWLSLEDSLHIPTEEADSLSNLRLQELTKLIQSLPTGYRTVFNLYAIEGYSHREIADFMDIAESTSKTQFMKAKSMLRHKLEVALKSNHI